MHAHERKKRQPVSCRRCRRHKKRCDRSQPCSGCVASNTLCSLLEVAQTESFAVQGGHGRHDDATQNLSQAESGSTWSFQTPIGWNHGTHPTGSSSSRLRYRAESGSSSNLDGRGDKDRSPNDLIALFTNTSFVDMLLTLWLSHFDYLYETVQATPLHTDWLNATLSISSASSQLPILSIIVALVCQLAPEKTKTILAACDMPQTNLVELGQDCMQYSKAECDRCICGYTSSDAVDDHVINSLHVSMLVSAFIKNAGGTTEYRTRLSRDISFLQCCGIHLLDRSEPVPQLASLSPPSLRLARHLFWCYYQCDRYIWMIDQTHPYQMRRSSADIHFYDEYGTRHHISDSPGGRRGGGGQEQSVLGDPVFLIPDEGTTGGSAPTAPGGDSETNQPDRSSRFTCVMICIATATELISDQCSDVESKIRAFNANLVTQSEVEKRFQEATSIVASQLRYLQRICESRQSIKRRATMHSMARQRQGHIMLTMFDSLKYRACSILVHLSSYVSPSTVTLLEGQKREAAAGLLRRASLFALDFPPSDLRWALFVNFIHNSTLELARMLQDRSTKPDASHVALAVSGRNLLCLISRDSALSFARDAASQACTAVAHLFCGISLPIQSRLLSQDVVDIDPVFASRIWESSGPTEAVSVQDPLETTDAYLVTPMQISPVADRLSTALVNDPVIDNQAICAEVLGVAQDQFDLLESLDALFNHTDGACSNVGLQFPTQ